MCEVAGTVFDSTDTILDRAAVLPTFDVPTAFNFGLVMALPAVVMEPFLD